MAQVRNVLQMIILKRIPGMVYCVFLKEAVLGFIPKGPKHLTIISYLGCLNRNDGFSFGQVFYSLVLGPLGSRLPRIASRLSPELSFFWSPAAAKP